MYLIGVGGNFGAGLRHRQQQAEGRMREHDLFLRLSFLRELRGEAVHVAAENLVADSLAGFVVVSAMNDGADAPGVAS